MLPRLTSPGREAATRWEGLSPKGVRNSAARLAPAPTGGQYAFRDAEAALQMALSPAIFVDMTKGHTSTANWFDSWQTRAVAGVLAVVLAVLGFFLVAYVSNIKDDISDLKKDTRSIAQEMAKGREDLLKAVASIERQTAVVATKLDGTNTRLDDAIRELRRRP